jgi:hypothetical protein
VVSGAVCEAIFTYVHRFLIYSKSKQGLRGEGERRLDAYHLSFIFTYTQAYGHTRAIFGDLSFFVLINKI